MSRARRETAADVTMLVAALVLLVSLFLVWSHQLSAPIVHRYGATGAFDGVPRNPDAWQVYTTADVLLALIAAALVLASLRGDRTVRLVLIVAIAIAIAFVVHAIGIPPTNGANVFDSRTGGYVPTGASSGAGELVALAALALAAAGVMLSLTSDL